MLFILMYLEGFHCYPHHLYMLPIEQEAANTPSDHEKQRNEQASSHFCLKHLHSKRKATG